MVGVFHSGGRKINYHPHVHYLVPAGGLSANRQEWISTRHNFLVPVNALSILFRATFRDAMKEAGLYDQVPAQVWQQDWVTHSKPIGKGKGALKYLAPYIFRVAISNHRILKVDEGKVTFRYRESDTGKWRTCTLLAEEFLRRFLQHGLPKGFVKVRYYGLFSPSCRYLLPLIHLWLDTSEEGEICDLEPHDGSDTLTEQLPVLCPTCGQVMRWVKQLQARSRCPP